MMTLDEAIEHAEQVAQGCEGECADDHRQLAEWLKELQALKAENEQYRELIRILDHDWNIEASWDGLRRFWYVGLNERGVAERDERDAENIKLKTENDALNGFLSDVAERCGTHECPSLIAYVNKLKELCASMWKAIPKSESCEWDSEANCCTGDCNGECGYWYRMRDLGIEVK